MNKACEACGGACCKGMILDVGRGTTADERRWLELHGYTKETRIRQDVSCTKLKDGKCSIYDFRPGMCKDLLVGSQTCLLSIKTWAPERFETVVALMPKQFAGHKFKEKSHG